MRQLVEEGIISKISKEELISLLNSFNSYIKSLDDKNGVKEDVFTKINVSPGKDGGADLNFTVNIELLDDVFKLLKDKRKSKHEEKLFEILYADYYSY